MEERRKLSLERFREILNEQVLADRYQAYFAFCAEYYLLASRISQEIQQEDYFLRPAFELAKDNRALYADILPENYAVSYANPAYTSKVFGTEIGQFFAFLCTELRAAAVRTFEGRLFDLTVVGELILSIYLICEESFPAADNQGEGEDYLLRNMKEACYYYAFDYAEIYTEDSMRESYCPEDCFSYKVLKKASEMADGDYRYLYRYGEYISENELLMVKYLDGLKPEEIKAMSDTFTEGYIRGFSVYKIDYEAKSVIQLRYPIGFERMVWQAVVNFEATGKRIVSKRCSLDMITRKPEGRIGFFATSCNPQYEFDHRYDICLLFDRKLKKKILDIRKKMWEKYKTDAASYAGPAVIGTFGEPKFEPTYQTGAVTPSVQQQDLLTELKNESGILGMNYVKNDETSYTIICYPLPSIGADFEAIFAETVIVNTLDNSRYQRIQQAMIDVLDRGSYVLVEGKGKNKTSMKVMLAPLSDPQNQTKFENCTADVNIPVGEVFTSPRLTGTSGVLHVSSVYLNGFEYKNLEIEFRDGFVTKYTCQNFEKEEENQRFIKESILMNRDTLPIGEFAIGTNTTAYQMGQKFKIQGKLPILIAEKTGPHFALGDTCYSRSEEHAVFNPDGKEIISRENEVSNLRHTDLSMAYFNCHTDITIPYDEVGKIAVVINDGQEEINIISDGKFCLPGTEKLNEML